MDRPILNIMSLYSGLGMLDAGVALGCDILGFDSRVLCYVERDAYPTATLLGRMEEKSLEPAPIWCGDIASFNASPFYGLVDILTASPPCQPYSVAGRQRGNEDQRSHYAPLVDAIRSSCPAVVFFENVPPWVAQRWFRPLGEELGRMGYQIEEPIFATAEAVGASHRRERVFILCHRDGIVSDYRRARLSATEQRGVAGVARDAEVDDEGKHAPAVAKLLGAPMADDDCDGLQGFAKQDEGRGLQQQQRRSDTDGCDLRTVADLFAPPPVDGRWGEILTEHPHLSPAIKSRFRVLVDGHAVVLDQTRTDQLRAAGNSVVATCAAAAFVELVRRIRR